MNNNSKIPIILQKENNPNKKDDLSRGIIKGQSYITNNKVFVNQNNSFNSSIWNMVDLTSNNINFENGFSTFIGYNVPKIIYHNLNRQPIFVKITQLDLNDHIGDIYICDMDDEKFGIINTGESNGRFTWFLI